MMELVYMLGLGSSLIKKDKGSSPFFGKILILKVKKKEEWLSG